MIIYLHGFDATNNGNHEKVTQLKFIDDDVRFIHYSTIHPKHDMAHIMQEVDHHIKSSNDKSPLICGVGLGGFWSERIGFLCGIKQVILNPNLHPENNMAGKIDWPEEYLDIATKCVNHFRQKNAKNCMCILSVKDDLLDYAETSAELSDYYPIILDQEQDHKFQDISHHLQTIKAFKSS